MQISFTLGEIDAAVTSATGGSRVLSYSLEVDDGNGGAFLPYYGLQVDSLSTHYLLI